MTERLVVLQEAAQRVERLRRRNPMNGDGSNYTIDRVLAALDDLAGDSSPSDAARAERAVIQREEEIQFFRLEATSARARGDAERERWALDGLALYEAGQPHD